MKDGNTTRVVLWHADTAIVKKDTPNGSYYFIADAVTGQPVVGAKVDFFGYELIYNGHWYKPIDRTEPTDADGGIWIHSAKSEPGSSLDLIASINSGGRFAYYGISNVWERDTRDHSNRSHEREFFMSDRPVYRPGDVMKFKFWVADAKYDRKGPSSHAGRGFSVALKNPRDQTLMEKDLVSDAYGGVDGEFLLPTDAVPGIYQCKLDSYRYGTFRVEEYKKPEYEVMVDAPTEPVILGEKLTATIQAKYYFGSPVTRARVKYTVTRARA